MEDLIKKNKINWKIVLIILFLIGIVYLTVYHSEVILKFFKNNIQSENTKEANITTNSEDNNYYQYAGGILIIVGVLWIMITLWYFINSISDCMITDDEDEDNDEDDEDDEDEDNNEEE